MGREYSVFVPTSAAMPLPQTLPPARSFMPAGMDAGAVCRVLTWRYGAGLADAERRTPATARTLYRMGSISKLFTDTAAMQLVAQGRLDLDEPVSRTLPWWRPHDAKSPTPVTLRQLMTHHSGLPRDHADSMWLQAAAGATDDFRAMLRGLPDDANDAPPGLAFSYSNVGLDLVGALVEAASGEPFEQRLSQSLLAPLGMGESTFSAALPASPHMARGHLAGQPQTEPALRDTPAGGLTASVDDIARFLSMQFARGRSAQGQTVLPASALAEMLRVQNADVPLDADMHIGLGWMFTTFGLDTVKGGGPVAHHAGATLYFCSQLMMLSDGNEVRLEPEGGRWWARYRLHPAFGGVEVRALLRPIPGRPDAVRLIGGPLADHGSVVKLEAMEAGRPQQVRYSGWVFERVGP